MSKGQHRNSALGSVEDEAIAWAQKFASGEATLEDSAAAERWRAQSPAHDAAFVEATRVWGKVGAAGRALHPQEDILAELDALATRRVVHRRALLGGGVASLAAAAVYGAVDPPYGLWPSLSALSADYRTDTGEQRNVTFVGNVSINLNTQTSLAVRPAEGGEDRIELITGEASFIAPARSARLLAVLAAGGKSVTESGRFDVRHTGGSRRSPVSVTCFEGQVRIEHKAEITELGPGQRVHYDASGFDRIVSIDPTVASDWQRGVVEFRGMSLVEAIEEINRYRRGRIILTNSALGQKQLSGRFRIDQMEQVLLQLEHGFSAKMRRLPGGIVLLG